MKATGEGSELLEVKEYKEAFARERKLEQGKASRIRRTQQFYVDRAIESSKRSQVQKLTDAELSSLVAQYQIDRSNAVYKRVEEHFINGFKYTATKWFIRSFSREDIVQTCCIALESAMSTFNPNRGVKFNSYAWTVVNRWLQDVRNSGSTGRESNLDIAPWDPPLIEALCPDLETDYSVKEVELRYDIEMIHLTDRQRFVLKGLLEGKQKQEIAAEMNMSPMVVSWEIKALRTNKEVQTMLGVTYEK